jgi:hypothetical protein
MAWKSTAVGLCAALVTGGCATAALQPMAVALAGAGTSTAINYSFNGGASRTFTAPLAEVKAASLDTLSLMGIRVDGFENTTQGETINGSAIQRSVSVDLEPISSKATRMRVVARNNGIFFDTATATEIVLQTEKALGVSEGSATVGPSRRTSRY